MSTISDASQREGHDRLQDHQGTRWTSRTKFCGTRTRQPLAPMHVCKGGEAHLRKRSSLRQKPEFSCGPSKASRWIIKPARHMESWIEVHGSRPDESRGRGRHRRRRWHGCCGGLAAGSIDVPCYAGRPCSSETWSCPRRGTCTSCPAVHIALLA